MPTVRSESPANVRAMGAYGRVNRLIRFALDRLIRNRPPSCVCGIGLQACASRPVHLVAVGMLVGPAPPAQIRASAPNAHGSYLGWVDAKRTSGYGWWILTSGMKGPRFS